MINVGCSKCSAYCCKNYIIPVNALDLAKILYAIEDYTFKEKERGFGAIFHNNRELITIIESQPKMTCSNVKFKVSIKNQCQFLNEKELCGLHDTIIKEDSILGRNLHSLEYCLSAKPKACRDYPFYIDVEIPNIKIKKYAACSKSSDIKLRKEQEITIINEFLLTGGIFNNLYTHWEKTGNLLIMKAAEELMHDENALSNEPLLKVYKKTPLPNER